MTAHEQLRARIAGYRDAEARALIHFLLELEEWSVSQRLNMAELEARNTVAECALDFLADAERKLP